MFTKYKIIRRNFGWFRRKFGIIFDPLKSHHRTILQQNNFIKKYSEDDQFIQIVLRVADMELQNKNLQFFWYNPLKDKVTTKREIEDASKEVDWECAICEADIISNMEDFSPSNFLCEGCKDAFEKTKTVDNRIKDSSVEFTKYCAKMLKRQQKDYMLFLRRNKRRN